MSTLQQKQQQEQWHYSKPDVKEKLPAQGKKLPAQGKKLSAQGKKLSAQGKKLPIQKEKLSAQEKKLPAKEEKLPALEEKLSAHEPAQRATIRAAKGGYVLGGTIGTGAFCKVKAAWCRKTKKMIAIKDLSKTALNKEIISKYLPREVAILRTLKHPHILETFRIMENDKRVLYMIELAENGDLLDYLETRGCLSEPETRYLFRQMLQAVGFCHSMDIAHRDLKCENIMLDKNMDVKIGDFGMATEKCSVVSTPCGSPFYGAPELLSKHMKTYDGKKADVWSLGIVLYVLLRGKFLVNFEVGPIATLPASHPAHVSIGSYYFMKYIMKKSPAQRPSIEDLQDSTWVKLQVARKLTPLSDKPKFTVETYLPGLIK